MITRFREYFAWSYKYIWKKFFITNYRKSLCDVFEDGVDLVVYYDEYDLLQKIKYYLSYEEERLKIAENGSRNK